MKTKLVPICSTICLVCAILAIGAALIWAPPCSGALELTNGNMVPMKCAYAAKAGIILATLIAICSALSFAKKDILFAVAATSLALAFIVMQLPGAIGVCKSDGMDCHTTAAWFISCGGISFVSSIVGIVLNPKRKKVKTK